MIKNYKLLIFIVASFLLILFEITYIKKDATKNNQLTKEQTAHRQQEREPQATPSKADDEKPNPAKDVNHNNIIENESRQIGLIDEHPDQTEKRLKELAYSLKPKDLRELKQKTLNMSLNGDDRMLSVYLLSLSQHENTAQLLEDIAATPIQIPKDQYRQYEFENVLRSQAIEGLQNRENKNQAISSLSKLISKLSDSYLLNRSQIALSHRTNNTDKVEAQDLNALKKIVR